MTVEDSDKKSDGTPTILTYQLSRNPCVFSGDEKQDVSRWLKDFERIASYNHWDDQMKLANVVFYLADTARLWLTTTRTISRSGPPFKKVWKRRSGE
ncbi:hypothetical protein AVEN_213465-1 [Araneus ventricosus]|uniref:Uncharacterized protein n=1 Tax=Araneus ventricosus TaxID=182803 RepID=A0A4Y2GAJ6_ARAVE|nr:hypothetical protein AVEN_232450-1 [Araneus ventricosus]GBM50886.1 hypothetical protein AVEN_65808-1 [Araneus ventricosus]GBM50912.1 hypothetical protein AVEN_183129-1 [Araneus ventricosus]GBM50924.1 hypothetical protein AVEN_213465-1 [Araneus ventricosus]